MCTDGIEIIICEPTASEQWLKWCKDSEIENTNGIRMSDRVRRDVRIAEDPGATERLSIR